MSDIPISVLVNVDAQLVIEVGDDQSFVRVGPHAYDRGATVYMAAVIIGRRILDGSTDGSMSVREFAFRQGAIQTTTNQGDRTLIEKYEDES